MSSEPRLGLWMGLAVAITRPLSHLLTKRRWEGQQHIPRRGGVILAANHLSWADPFTLGHFVYKAGRIPRFMAKESLFRAPVIGRVVRGANQIPVHRGTPDRTALQAGLRVITGGGDIGLFPEGTRGTGQLTAIQHGIGYLALQGKCPVVPVVCQGTAAALPKGKKLPRWRAPIDVIFGPAFTVEVDGDPRARSTIAAAAEQVRLGLLAHLQAVSGTAPGADERRSA